MKIIKRRWKVFSRWRNIFTKRNRTIYRLRNNDKRTLASIGRVFGLTRERVRQIIALMRFIKEKRRENPKEAKKGGFIQLNWEDRINLNLAPEAKVKY